MSETCSCCGHDVFVKYQPMAGNDDDVLCVDCGWWFEWILFEEEEKDKEKR